MHIDEFNALDPAAAAALVRVWADVPRWTDAVVAGRPYPDADALAAAADGLAAQWSDDEVAAALHQHPRIGERRTGASAEDAASRREQASATTADERTAVALRDGNAAYEARFDRVFLIRAAGRSADEVLAELARRTANDPDAEAAEVAGALREIAALRLADTVPPFDAARGGTR